MILLSGKPVKADVPKPVAAGAANSNVKIKQLAKDATVDSEEDSSDDDDEEVLVQYWLLFHVYPC